MMQNLSLPLSFARLLRWCCVALSLSLLAACHGVPASSAQVEQRAQALRDLGFQRVGDDWELQMLGPLLFEFNSDDIKGQRRESVLQMGRALRKLGVDSLRVEGHADDQGSAEYNNSLSQRRAQKVADILVEAGIPREHIEVRSYGASRPLAIGTSEAVRQGNRRVALIVPGQ